VVRGGARAGHRPEAHPPAPPREIERLRLVVLEDAAEPAIRELSAFDALAQAGEAPPRSPGDLDRLIESFPAFGPFHAQRARLREAERDHQGALDDVERALALEEEPARFHERANLRFKLSRFKEALADYDRSIEGGGPHDADSCWERGLALYYLGDFEAGRRQFEGYHRVGPLDIENGLWRFLCTAEREGIEKARATALEYRRRERRPFPALLDLYLGRGSPEKVLAEAVDGVTSGEERNEALFYAHYYLGKHFEVTKDREAALRHLKEALGRRIPHFMYDCARLDRERLEAAK